MSAVPELLPGDIAAARTRDEREAVYRLRYDVYMRELRKGFLPNVDHERRWVEDPEDEEEGSSLFYAGDAHDMRGSLRLQIWEPGRVPADVYHRFSLDLIPGIDALRVSEVARLIVRPEARGGVTLTGLACAAFAYGATRHDVFLCFAYCSPGLVRTFARLGFRPYAGRVIPNADGIRLPMLMAGLDVERLRGTDSPLAPLLAKYVRPGDTPPQLTAVLKAVDRLPAHYEIDPGRVWQEVEEKLRPGDGTRSRFLHGVSAADAEALCERGIVMEIPPDRVVMREGLVERDLYLVLEGEYAVSLDGKEVARLGAGDVLGEVSFFQAPGERIATVRSLTPGRVMVLDRHFLDDIARVKPELACRLLLNLGRIVSGHLSCALRAYVERAQDCLIPSSRRP